MAKLTTATISKRTVEALAVDKDNGLLGLGAFGVPDLLTDRVNDPRRFALRRKLKTLHPALLTGYLDRFVGN